MTPENSVFNLLSNKTKIDIFKYKEETYKKHTTLPLQISKIS